MTDPNDREHAGPVADFALMDRLVEAHPELSDEELIKLYQQQTQGQPQTIALLSDSVAEKTEVLLASALPQTAVPQNTRSQAQYKIDKKLDAGGQSNVYLAHRNDGAYQKRVVIKVLNQTIKGDTQKDLMLAEMQILADLKHPHIVAILDAGTDSQQRPWLMLEYIDGPHIDAYVQDSQPSASDLIRLCLKIASALHYIHLQGITHADIKPANILIERPATDAEPVLIDFGIATTSQWTGEAVEYTFATPAFASPEQLAAIQPDHRSDIFSFGRLLQHVLSLSYSPKTQPTQNSRQDTNPDLQAILDCCLEPHPGDRYPNMQAVIGDLESHLFGRAVSVRPLGWMEASWRGMKEHALLAVGALSVLLFVAVLLVWVAKQADDHESNLIEQTQASQLYWQRADEISNETRLIYALPKRNIEPDFLNLNRRYEQLAKSWLEEPNSVRNLSSFAMAEAAISLGWHHEAQKYLLVAHAHDPSQVEVQQLLSNNYLTLYQQEVVALQKFARLERRQAHQQRLKQQYVVPAVALWQANTVEANDTNQVNVSLLLYFEGQTEAALQVLADTKQQKLWPIERLLLAAQILQEEANRYLQAGQQALAVEFLQQAMTALKRAKGIARSHPEVYQQLCQTEGQLMQYQTVENATVIEGCEDLLQILPRRGDMILVTANAYSLLAKARLEQGKSPIVQLDRALALINKGWSQDKVTLFAESELILGAIHRTMGLWRLYSNEAVDTWLEQAVGHNQSALALLPNDFTAQLALAMSMLSVANNSVEVEKKERYYEQAAVLMTALLEHADSTELLGSQLVRLLTDHAYHRYQNGLVATEQLNRAEALVKQTQNTWPESTYTYQSLANLYWTITDYLVFQGIDPKQHLQQAVGYFEQVIAADPGRWANRYNQISALLSGVTYYLAQGVEQNDRLQQIAERLQKLSQSVSADVNLDSHYGYYYNMLALNQLLQKQDPKAALEQSRAHNMACIDNTLDGYQCYSQMATLFETEHRWQSQHQNLVLGNWQQDLKITERALNQYPDYHELRAQIGRIKLLVYQWQSAQAKPPLQWLIDAQKLLSQAVQNNPLLKPRFQSDIDMINDYLAY